MSSRIDAKSIDANILIEYILQHQSKDRDRKNRISRLFNPANDGDREIRIFVYTLGEVFKRILETKDNKTVNFGDDQIQTHLGNIQSWIKKRFIVPIKMDELIPAFHNHYKKIDLIDGVIKQGDKLTLSAFCADIDSKSYYSFDKGITQSVKLLKYVSNLGKRIQEP